MQGKRILNIGCGDDTYGTDFVDKYPKRRGVIRCDIDEEKLPFKANTFDEVYSKCLLEHLKNPNKAFKEMTRVLKPKGKLVIITDNAGWWGFHTPISTVHYGGYEKHADKRDKHYSIFTSWHLQNHLKELKMRNIQVKYTLLKEKIPQFYVRFFSHFLFMIGLERIAYPHLLAWATKP